MTSLISAAQATNAHIIGLAETKLGKTYPAVQGYKWVNKPRKNKGGGGVAILVREDIAHLTEEVPDLEDQDQEVAWIKLETARSKTFIGIFYGPGKMLQRRSREAVCPTNCPDKQTKK